MSSEGITLLVMGALAVVSGVIFLVYALFATFSKTACDDQCCKLVWVVAASSAFALSLSGIAVIVIARVV